MSSTLSLATSLPSLTPLDNRGQCSSLSPSRTLLTETQAAEWLQVSVRTLQNWRLRGGTGPVFIKAGRAVRYRTSDLFSWLDVQCRRSTSDPGPGDPGARQ
jgi:hypothetical protein